MLLASPLLYITRISCDPPPSPPQDHPQLLPAAISSPLGSVTALTLHLLLGPRALSSIVVSLYFKQILNTLYQSLLTLPSSREPSVPAETLIHHTYAYISKSQIPDLYCQLSQSNNHLFFFRKVIYRYL